jgi:hypothetical protein
MVPMPGQPMRSGRLIGVNMLGMVAAIVMTVDPLPVIEGGLKLQLDSDGKLEQDAEVKLIVPL